MLDRSTAIAKTLNDGEQIRGAAIVERVDELRTIAPIFGVVGVFFVKFFKRKSSPNASLADRLGSRTFLVLTNQRLLAYSVSTWKEQPRECVEEWQLADINKLEPHGSGLWMLTPSDSLQFSCSPSHGRDQIVEAFASL